MIDRDVGEKSGWDNPMRVFTHLTEYTGFADLEKDDKTQGIFGRLLHPANLPVADSRSFQFGSIDGRANHAVLGAFGGDVGEFLLALNALEHTQSLGDALTQSQVHSYFRSFLADLTRKFYVATDAQHWILWKKETAEFGVKDPLTAKTARERARVLESAPVHFGCRHLQLMMEQEQHYRVRRELVQYVIRAVFAVLLDRTNIHRHKIIFDILEGYPNGEQAFVNIMSPGPEDARAYANDSDFDRVKSCAFHAPLILPRLNFRSDQSIYVYHPRAVYEARATLARYVATAHKRDQPWALKLFALINAIGKDQMTMTKKALAFDKHTFLATFT